MSTSADTTPITPARFAAALRDLSPALLHLKVLEIRNSIAHLQYSNDQLRPFADGSATALSDSSQPGAPDQDCVDAIRENEAVIDRMATRIALVQEEVERRGMSWTEFEAMDVQTSKKDEADVPPAPPVNGTTTNGSEHPAWSDGTFQTGTIRNGEVHLDNQPSNSQPSRPQGGSLSDEQLMRAIEQQMRGLEDDDEEGMHL